MNLDDKGFIQLHRKIMDSEVFASDSLFRIWTWCLMKANYKTRSVVVQIGNSERLVTVNRGQFVFGNNKAALELNRSKSKIYRALQFFKQKGMVLIQVNNHFSIITICKYDTYQTYTTEVETQTNSRRTADEEQMKTTNKANKDNKDKNEYSTPLEFLKLNCEAWLIETEMKMRLPSGEFNKALTQWSLKCEETGFSYSADKDGDIRKLRAGFQKWLNSWKERLETRSHQNNNRYTPPEPPKYKELID